MIKNNRIILIIIFLMFFSAMAIAQEDFISINIRGGLNFSTYGGKLHDTKTVLREQAGIGVDIAVAKNIYLVTGIDFQTKGTKIKPGSGQKIKYNAHYLQAPLHMAYKIKLSHNIKVLAEIGPYVAYGIGGKIKAEEKINTFGDGRLKKFDCGGGIAAGLEINRSVLKVGYDHGFSNISDIKGVKIRNRNLFITSGFIF